VTTAEAAVRAASAAQATALRDVPPATARAAIEALRGVLLALGDSATPSGGGIT
jgi:hypothetical protein